MEEGGEERELGGGREMEGDCDHAPRYTCITRSTVELSLNQKAVFLEKLKTHKQVSSYAWYGSNVAVWSSGCVWVYNYNI